MKGLVLSRASASYFTGATARTTALGAAGAMPATLTVQTLRKWLSGRPDTLESSLASRRETSLTETCKSGPTLEANHRHQTAAWGVPRGGKPPRVGLLAQARDRGGRQVEGR